MQMLPAIFLAAILLPLASTAPKKTKGGTNCKTRKNRYGPVCYSDTSSIRRPGATIQYKINGRGVTRICCKAYTCLKSRCYMKYIGCGRDKWSSASLKWEGRKKGAKPKMQCKARRSSYVRYSFKTTH